MTRLGLPVVSIGMPAYNSEATIGLAIDCLLEQDFEGLELIISDNASTDGTWSIIEDRAARDSRVVALRQPTNIGANGNYSAVMRPARGVYFKWASSNDWCAPQFVSRCVAHLQAHADTVLVAPRAKLFESLPESGTAYDDDRAFDHADALQRFIDVTSKLKLNNVLNGVIRTQALRRTRLIEHHRGADIVLVGHLALLGKIALLDEPLFGRRMSRETATRLMSAEALHKHHYPMKTWRSSFPSLRMATGWTRAVLASDLSLLDTLRALARVAHMTYWNGAQIRRDVVEAVRFPMR